jgi:hypothetical protein
MEMDAAADQARRDEVAFDELPQGEHAGHQPDHEDVLELERGDEQADRRADQHADIGHEGEQTGKQADHQPILQADQPQTEAVKHGKEQADHGLTAEEAGQDLVALAGEIVDRGPHVRREQTAQLGDHDVPVAQEVEGHNRRHEHQRQEVDRCQAGLEDAAQRLASDAQDALAELRHDVLGLHQIAQRPERGQPIEQRPEPLARSGQKGRQLLHQVGGLYDDQRHEQAERQNEEPEKGDRDRQRRNAAAQTGHLQAVRDWVEQVGSRQPDQERQQEAAEDEGAERQKKKDAAAEEREPGRAAQAVTPGWSGRRRPSA